jgi:hypothetical protein
VVGIHNIGFVVDNLDKETARFTDIGVTVLHSARQENGGGAVYLDIELGGLVFELEKLFEQTYFSCLNTTVILSHPIFSRQNQIRYLTERFDKYKIFLIPGAGHELPEVV